MTQGKRNFGRISKTLRSFVFVCCKKQVGEKKVFFFVKLGEVQKLRQDLEVLLNLKSVLIEQKKLQQTADTEITPKKTLESKDS